jgi:hypothetical protein
MTLDTIPGSATGIQTSLPAGPRPARGGSPDEIKIAATIVRLSSRRSLGGVPGKTISATMRQEVFRLFCRLAIYCLYTVRTRRPIPGANQGRRPSQRERSGGRHWTPSRGPPTITTGVGLLREARPAMTTDTRLIEDYIPIEAISAEARREKSIRKGHISTLHL